MNPQYILHWSYRDFREFPNELLEHIDTLEEIYLKENFIPTLPPWLFQFVHLKFIQISGNLLQNIPSDISELTNLEHLDVSKNQLIDLPKEIYDLNKLQYLNVSDNEITSVDKAIGDMKSLETLNLEKNHLTEIPLEISRSTTLNELFLSDNNNLTEIPTKIMAMQSLRVMEAERCRLEYLPGMVGINLSHIRIFNNPRLTHYPTVYEKFLRLHYDYWSENVVSADLLMIFLPDESKRTIVPRQVEKICSGNNPNSLSEYCLRSLYESRSLYEIVCVKLPSDGLPKNVFQNVMCGPICRCGYSECNKPLFTECHFSLMKKNHSPSHIIFSNMFCSETCRTKWHDDHKAKYHPIGWIQQFH
ncbi:leucine-rich repeat and death domain-containing protein 1 [Contarinia nasturtii]|uniref:leucine-rich repeat and death domain-containing protein 1 n=1 Tax=Contarinia nasturtii TaxID=265458 RepID=UPI0012D48301|nr:leucine-rich repeat and death domain-containing protein 1 [Contarinia nasturtii]